MLLPLRLYVLLLAPLAVACSAKENSKDPVFSAKFQNEKRIGEENITKRQLRDAEFLVEAASQKMELLEISQIAQRKATSPDTRYVAQNAIAQLSARLQELKTLAQQKNRALPTGLGESQAQEVGELTALNGPAFDQKYAEMLSSLTDKTVDAYEDMADEAYDGDIRALAARQLPALKDQHTAGEALQDKLKP
ncbi:putative membrane protein [Hymenobacter luteus]|uniref:Membrane protein n=2 Tax=Hymenobacter TaxID=89966 RepID=A0ABR6K2F3_9BACT|nr:MULTISPECIES: DUF4142 domain-containing protein [Hymenobacter]MBB4603247.1 putative membrane protein [Hymenobacter latericoloratus]MBB6060145.1 putative membrane protein [Hymenobacter luteus]